METDISAYSLSELLAILDLQEFDADEIRNRTNAYIQRYRNRDDSLVQFFQDAQQQLLRYADQVDANPEELDDEDPVYDDTLEQDLIENKINPYYRDPHLATFQPSENIVQNWIQNQYLRQQDPVQVDKITDRRQKFQLFNDDHVPMNREQLATTDTFQVPVKQDTLNPNLKNTINRFINLDSQFRQYSAGGESSSTNYTLDLSDTLKDALSLSLYSYQIPFSWYVIDEAYGNNTFWIYDVPTNLYVTITIPSGNYVPTSLTTELNKQIAAAGFSAPLNAQPFVQHNPSNGRVTLYFTGSEYEDPTNPSRTFLVTDKTQFLFYDFTGTIQIQSTACLTKTNFYFNGTLGWLMGFRLPYVTVDMANGNTGTAVLDLNGTKYLILVIDDYNQNHVNNSLVSIAQQAGIFKTPLYASPDLPYTCFTQGSNLPELLGDLANNNDPNVGLLIASKFEQDRAPTELLLPSAPALLTQAQLYTANEINRNRNNLTRFLSKAPTTSDILAMIPVKTSVGVPTGSLLVEFSGSLQDNKRTYFGPVNLERMAVKLLNDKGQVLNLNGNDWCCTLICECLYQY